MPGRAYVGTSGWNYSSWRESFYEGRPKKEWLRFCAERFTAIEVNATHYRLQSKEVMKRWREETPPGFRFAIKGHRYLTHRKKLGDPASSIALERERATGLGTKLAAVVWQLPANFHKNLERLERFARALGRFRRPRHAIEFRHTSWFDDEVEGVLREHGMSVCQSDAADWPLWDKVTTDLVYVRLHGHERTYVSDYSAAQLDEWARKAERWMEEGRDVHVYFDNDAQGHAPRNALELLERLSKEPVSSWAQ
jgi:uncharacterized protein YecE (DUF72 family)